MGSKLYRLLSEKSTPLEVATTTNSSSFQRSLRLLMAVSRLLDDTSPRMASGSTLTTITPKGCPINSTRLEIYIPVLNEVMP